MRRNKPASRHPAILYASQPLASQSARIGPGVTQVWDKGYDPWRAIMEVIWGRGERILVLYLHTTSTSSLASSPTQKLGYRKTKWLYSVMWRCCPGQRKRYFSDRPREPAARACLPGTIGLAKQQTKGLIMLETRAWSGMARTLLRMVLTVGNGKNNKISAYIDKTELLKNICNTKHYWRNIMPNKTIREGIFCRTKIMPKEYLVKQNI